MRTLGSLFETDIPTSRYYTSRSAIVKRAGPLVLARGCGGPNRTASRAAPKIAVAEASSGFGSTENGRN